MQAMRKILVTILAATLSLPSVNATAATPSPKVRIAEIEVVPGQLAAYRTLLAEEQEASVRLEPGVLMLHSAAIAAEPTQIRLLEVYADQAAYEAHIRSPHFVKYKTLTERMIKSLKLIEATPILLCAKAARPTTCR
jgi:quinol monooxygenase YgiN